MPYIAVTPGGGMGNQLFIMAVALGYVERFGYVPVYWEEPKSSCEHRDSQFRVQDMFKWRVLTEEERKGGWMLLREAPDAPFTYTPLSCDGRNVKLEGYFQSDLYGPSTFPTPPPPLLLTPALIAHPWHRTFFLHVRRGDYLEPVNQHHAVELGEYWRICLRDMDPSWTCFVVSDDMDWCQSTHGIRGIVGDVWKGEWLWCPKECSDVETIFWMVACERGGICANSTFSWWAAWYIRRRVGSRACVYMPRKWGNSGLPTVRHLHPSWALLR
jgi:hypothetical protein